MAIIVIVFTLFVSGCYVNPHAPWPIGDGGYRRPGSLGSPEANLGRAEELVHRYQKEVMNQKIANQKLGEAKALSDWRAGEPFYCFGPPEMEAAYWRTLRQLQEREFRIWQSAERDRGRAIGLGEIKNRK